MTDVSVHDLLWLRGQFLVPNHCFENILDSPHNFQGLFEDLDLVLGL